MHNILKIFKKTSYFWYGLGVVQFILICSQIHKKYYPQIDTRILDIFAAARNNSQINWIFRTIYLSGGTYIAGTISIIVLAILIRKKYKREAKVFVFASLGILLLEMRR